MAIDLSGLTKEQKLDLIGLYREFDDVCITSNNVFAKKIANCDSSHSLDEAGRFSSNLVMRTQALESAKGRIIQRAPARGFGLTYPLIFKQWRKPLRTRRFGVEALDIV